MKIIRHTRHSMNYQHKDLASGRWGKLSLMEQLANIGSEVERAIRWRQKGNAQYSRLAFDRALELLDLSLHASIHFPTLKELARVRSALVDDFAGDNTFHSTDTAWQRYFAAFTWAARTASPG
jgi:hypothetical protein